MNRHAHTGFRSDADLLAGIGVPQLADDEVMGLTRYFNIDTETALIIQGSPLGEHFREIGQDAWRDDADASSLIWHLALDLELDDLVFGPEELEPVA